jgi:hypothetical protein
MEPVGSMDQDERSYLGNEEDYECFSLAVVEASNMGYPVSRPGSNLFSHCHDFRRDNWLTHSTTASVNEGVASFLCRSALFLFLNRLEQYWYCFFVTWSLCGQLARCSSGEDVRMGTCQVSNKGMYTSQVCLVYNPSPSVPRPPQVCLVHPLEIALFHPRNLESY